MPSAGNPHAHLAETDRSAETLSQFLSRVLDQLSLAAWLPAGALVLTISFLVQLAAATGRVDRAGRAPSVVEALQGALDSLSNTSLGGGALLLGAVIVVTMITQAFSFETIRTFEGYWGPGKSREFLADVRCRRHEGRLVRLEERVADLKQRIWSAAESRLLAENRSQQERDLRPPYPEKVLVAPGWRPALAAVP